MFVDEVDVLVAAGKGGRGSISFRREKFIPRGGPDGGDGGPGGSVFLVASPHHNTLVNFRFHPEFSAEPGGNGSGSNRTGKTGKELQDLKMRTDSLEQALQYKDQYLDNIKKVLEGNATVKRDTATLNIPKAEVSND